MNRKIIRALTAANGETPNDLAHFLGISRQMLSDKVAGRNGADFTESDITEVKRHYHLSAEQIDLIFFDA